MASDLVLVDGVVAVALGGSRARGTHTEDSDFDLGLYYRSPLDTDGLGELARRFTGPDARVTAPGAWGPWVDGGAWLRFDDAAVDWIYRDLDRVGAAWRAAQNGRYTFHQQVGHPLGVPDFTYVAEVALGLVLADPSHRLGELQSQITAGYPPALAAALVAGLWEATFLIDAGRKAVSRGDTVFVAGVLFRVVAVCAHALHGRAGAWITHEKGLVAAAGALDVAPRDFAQRAHDLLARVGEGPADLTATLDAAAVLLRSVTDAVETASDPPSTSTPAPVPSRPLPRAGTMQG